MPAEQLALDASDQPLPPPGARVAVTLPDRHFHGTIRRHLTGPDEAPRADITDVSGDGATCGAVLRPGPHLRPTSKGETCPDCGRPDPGPSSYRRI